MVGIDFRMERELARGLPRGVSVAKVGEVWSERLNSELVRRFRIVPSEFDEIFRDLLLPSVSSISSTQSDGGGPVTAREDVTASRTGNGVKFRTWIDMRCRIR